jgi:hypothetical protein
MTIETQLLREIADRVVKARNAKVVLDVNATALALSQKYTDSKMSVAEIRDALEKAAVAQGAARR